MIAQVLAMARTGRNNPSVDHGLVRLDVRHNLITYASALRIVMPANRATTIPIADRRPFSAGVAQAASHLESIPIHRVEVMHLKIHPVATGIKTALFVPRPLICELEGG